MYYSETDYTQMFLELGFSIPRGSKGMVSCPKHTDRHPSMSINLTTGLFNCFSCQFHGRIDKEYFRVFGKRFEKKTNFTTNELREVFKYREKPKILPTKKNYFKATYKAYNVNILRKWLDYRGIKPEVADVAKVFYGEVNITYTDDFGKEKSYTIHDRVVFPIYDENNKLCSLEMRFPFFGAESTAFKESIRKVLYPKNSTVNLLYEQSKLDKTKKLYVMEGLMDCLAFRSLTGINNSTSIFGAQLTTHQKELLNEFPKVCYVYNNDTAGINSLNSMKQSYKGSFTELKPANNFDDVGEMVMSKFKDVDKWLKTEH